MHYLYPNRLSRTRSMTSEKWSRAAVFLTVWGGSVGILTLKLGLTSDAVAKSTAAASYLAALAIVAFSRKSQKVPQGFIVGVLLMIIGETQALLFHPEQIGSGLGGVVELITEFTVLVLILRLPVQGYRQQLLSLVTRAGLPIVVISLIAGIIRAPFAFSGTTTAFLGQDSGPAGRLSGITLQPNTLGTISALVAIALITADRPRRRWLWVSLCAVTVIWTDQRSAMIGMAIALLTWGLLRLRKPYQIGLSLVGAPIALLAAIGIAQLFNALLNTRPQSVSSREVLWNYLLVRWREYIPNGLGPRGVYEMATNTSDLPEEFFHAHNQLLTTAVTGGAFALIGLVLVLIGWLGTPSGGRLTPAVICFAGLVPLLAVESPLHTGLAVHLQPAVMLAWLLCAANWGGTRAPEVIPDSDPELTVAAIL